MSVSPPLLQLFLLVVSCMGWSGALPALVSGGAHGVVPPRSPALPAAPTTPKPTATEPAAAEPTSGEPALLTLASHTPGDRFGAALASLGDVDGDGVPDLAVGAPRADGPGPTDAAGLVQDAGRVLVVSGRDGRALLQLAGDSDHDTFGWSLAGMGDVDGDGVPDLLVGSPAGDPSSGSAAVYSGADGALLRSYVGVATGDRFGHALACAGDVDGDGVPDVLIGAPQADGAGANAGRASVFSGADGSLLFAFEGGPFDQAGLSVAGVGDVDGDGRPDVLVGVPFSDVGAFNGGSAYLLSGRDGSVLAAHHGEGAGDLLGHQVAGVGDVDGDGVPDLGLVAPGSDVGGLDSGGAFVRSGATGTLLLPIAGDQEGTWLNALAGAGDVDRDGHADLVVGAASAGAGEAGRLRVVSGATGAELLVVDGQRPFDWFGAAVCGVGDLDGDGLPDVAGGAPGHDDVLTKQGSVRAFTAAPR